MGKLRELVQMGVVIEGFEGFGLTEAEQRELASESYWLASVDPEMVLGGPIDEEYRNNHR